jgi:hypothetical protein
MRFGAGLSGGFAAAAGDEKSQMVSLAGRFVGMFRGSVAR